MVDSTPLDGLEIDDAINAISASEDFIGVWIQCQGHSGPSLDAAIHHWTGKVPPL
jgi:hypothetical protein